MSRTDHPLKENSGAALCLNERNSGCRLLVDHCPDLLLNLSLGGLFLDVSPSWERIAGYTAESLVGMPFVRLVHPEDSQAYFDFLKEAMSTGEILRSPEYRLRHADGTWHRHAATVTPVRDAKGEPVSMVGVSREITERNLSENALRESERIFRKIFQTNQDSISINRLSDGAYALVNEEYTRQTGYTEAELVGKTDLDMNIWVNPVDRERLIVMLGRDGKVRNFKADLRAKDGTIRFCIISASVIDLDGVPHLLNVTHDVTDRKLAERKQRQSEEKFRILMENATESIHISQDGMMKYVNSASVKIFGYSKEELASRPFTDFIHPDDRALVLDRHTERQKGSVLPTRYTYRMIHASGETRWVEINTVLVEWDGKPATLNFLFDITDRRIAEMELERARDFIANAEDACCEFDLKSNLIFCNERFLKSTGYTFEEYKALSPWDRHPTKEEAKRVFRIYESVRRTGIPARSVEFQIVHKDGSIATSETSISLIRDKSGKPVGFRGIGRDVTARKKREEERRQLEERLRQAEKMKAIGTLAGGVAHDLNNMMGVVLGYAELLLLRVDETSPIRGNLISIQNAGRRAAAVVQDLLTLARRGVYRTAVLNPNAIISDFLNSPEFKALSSRHPAVELKTNLEPDVLNLFGSSVHLGKALFNLVCNACEAMPAGGVVTIGTANQYLDQPIEGYDRIREGDYIVLTVSDTGEGIGADDLERIFEPFYTKKSMGRSGTGLGLAVVWGTVKDHDGYINVASEKGKGSTFKLYFPVSRKEITPEKESASMSEYMGHGESILVVDDVEGQRELAARMLRMMNYKVQCAASGEEAVAYLKENSADLLILDMIMEPGMDGLDTYRAILKINPKQRAIIVSGFSESGRVREAQTLGAGAYIRKPYVIEKLGSAVKEELKRKQ